LVIFKKVEVVLFRKDKLLLGLMYQRVVEAKLSKCFVNVSCAEFAQMTMLEWLCKEDLSLST